MNIFYLDHDPKVCAQYHNNKHVVKMILESAQLLSTAHRVLDGEERIEKNAAGSRIKRYYLNDERDDILYKSTHMNHPSAVWVRQSRENYMWLYSLFVELMIEYTYRYGKHHASERLIPYLQNAPINISDKPFTQPTAAMDAEFIISTDNIVNYRNYYKLAKAEMHEYKDRPVPSWLLDSQI